MGVVHYDDCCCVVVEWVVVVCGDCVIGVEYWL